VKYIRDSLGDKLDRIASENSNNPITIDWGD